MYLKENDAKATFIKRLGEYWDNLVPHFRYLLTNILSSSWWCNLYYKDNCEKSYFCAAEGISYCDNHGLECSEKASSFFFGGPKKRVILVHLYNDKEPFIALSEKWCEEGPSSFDSAPEIIIYPYMRIGSDNMNNIWGMKKL